MRLVRDPADPQLRFVLRVAAALRDKPKPPKPGFAPCAGVAGPVWQGAGFGRPA